MDIKIKLIKEDGEISQLLFGEEEYNRFEGESLEEFINGVAEELAFEGVNFSQYFKKGNVEVVEINHISDKQVAAVIDTEGEEVKQIKEQHEANANLKQKVSNKKKVVAVIVAIALLLGGYVAGQKGVFAKLFNSNDTKQEQMIYDVENKSVEELLAMLDENGQKQAFEQVVNVQDYFNNVASASVVRKEDKDARLFLYADEIESLYLYANAQTITSDELAKYFGNSLIFKNKKGEYETLTADRASDKYVQAMQVLNYYYTRATEPSGISNIFKDQEEKKFFEDFETLVLNYNKNKGSNEKSALQNRLIEIYLSGDEDSLYEKYPGACSIIGTAMVPYLEISGVISNEKEERYTNINEKVTCDGIYNQIKDIQSKLKEKDTDVVVSKLTEIKNKDLENKNRNIVMTQSLTNENPAKDYSMNGIKKTQGTTTVNGKEIKNGDTVKGTTTKKKVTKEKAVQETSKPAVEKAEQEANKEIQDKNEAENNYWDDYSLGYNNGYDSAWNSLISGGSTPSAPTGKSAGYTDGFKAGIKAAKDDYNQSLKDQEEYDKAHKQEVVEEIKESPKIIQSVERDGVVYENPQSENTDSEKVRSIE